MMVGMEKARNPDFASQLSQHSSVLLVMLTSFSKAFPLVELAAELLFPDGFA